MKIFYALVVLCIVQSCIAESEERGKAVHSDDRGRLIAKLFENYDQRNYPTNNVLNVGLHVIRFSADQLNKIFNVDAWIQMVWSDPRLEWDPSDYGGEKAFTLPVEQVWTPDLALYNAVDHENLFACSKTRVVIQNNGTVLWVPPCKFKANCNVKPFEDGPQNCTLKFGPWTLDENILDIKLISDKAILDDMSGIGNLELTGNLAYRNSTVYPCCAEHYVSVTYDFTFQLKH